LLTIFTIPKPFTGATGLAQCNALRSWTGLRPACEIIMFGDEEGTKERAAEFGARHVPDVACSEFGTPRLDDAFGRAEAMASFPLLCFVNADIVLPATFAEAVAQVRFPAFLMVGQRWDVDVTSELDFGDPSAVAIIESTLSTKGSLHPAWGSDYFVFTKGALGELPPFVVGRAAWDNWMIYRARRLRLPVVDASDYLAVYHQNHGPARLPPVPGQPQLDPEFDANRRLIDVWAQQFTSAFATWRFDGAGLVRRPWWTRGRGPLLREAAALHPWTRPFVRAAIGAARSVRRSS
jgi:hypothetical protein